MGRIQQVRSELMIQADCSGIDVEPRVLIVGNPLRNRPLAVPRDVRQGDTPDGDPAIWWILPPERDRYCLEFDWAAGGTARSAFWAFLDLADQQDSGRFVGFVKRFGPLGLWDYRTPTGHKVFGLVHWVPSMIDGVQTPYRFTSYTGDFWQKQADGLVGMMYEPIEEWRWWARQFRAAVRIALSLRSGASGSGRDWKELGWGHEFDPNTTSLGAPFARDLPKQRRALVAAIQTGFLRWSGLTPALRWDADGPRLDLALGGRHAVQMRRASMQFDWPENILFPALVAQLVAIVVAGEPAAECAGCGRLHPRDRKPRPDQPAYCSEVCRAAARRKTKRESARKRRAGTSCRAGSTPIPTPIPADSDGRQRTK